MSVKFAGCAAGALFVAVSSIGITTRADAPVAPQLVPLSDFAKPEEFKRVKISPNGDYIAATFDDGDQDDLVTIDLKHKKVLGKFQVGKNFRVGDFWWVSPKRLVFSLNEQVGGLATPYFLGELLGVDVDGSAQKYLFGYRAGNTTSTTGTLIKGAEARRAWGRMINPLPEDPNTALIAIQDHDDGDKHGRVEVARLNVNSGALNTIDTAPMTGRAYFLADDAGTARLVIGEDDHRNYLTFVRRPGETEWLGLNVGEAKKARIFPVTLSADGKRAFLFSDQGGDRLCLVEQDLVTAASKTLRCDETGDINSVEMSFDRQEAIAVTTSTRTQLLDTPNPDRERLARLWKSFPGQTIDAVSATRDGSVVVVRVTSDHNPGDYYLFSPKTLKADYLASRRSWIDPEQMSERRTLDFKARDGQTIHGVLTLPAGRPSKGLPLIVNPHGGPFDVYDTWLWDAEPQMLASRGYAVLQVNFRGSGGYGAAYREAGRQAWDTVMIDDITDATRSLIAQGTVDASRTCIYGASYGGYASLMSAVREPELYRCVIAYAGIYDLNLWTGDSDISESGRGRTYFDEFVGNDERLKKASPLTYIDRLKAPVLIVHGSADERVPVNQARALRSALEARKIPYEWLVKAEEGHGFYKAENRVELYTKMLAFIEKNIGPGAAPSTAAAAGPTDSK